MTSVIPMMGAARGAASVVATTAAGAAMSGINVVASEVKAKAEVTLSYKLVKDTPEIQANALKTKAKADGEDVLTPLVQQVATAVLTQVTNKDGAK